MNRMTIAIHAVGGSTGAALPLVSALCVTLTSVSDSEPEKRAHGNVCTMKWTE